MSLVNWLHKRRLTNLEETLAGYEAELHAVNAVMKGTNEIPSYLVDKGITLVKIISQVQYRIDKIKETLQ